MRAGIRQPQRMSMSDARGAADNNSGLALQIKKGRTHEGTVFSDEIGSCWFDRRYSKRYIESISERLNLETAE
jgi:hypothetical protein